MAKQKGLPTIFWVLAFVVLVLPFAWKFSPLLRLDPEREAKARWEERQRERKASLSADPAPTPAQEGLAPTGTSATTSPLPVQKRTPGGIDLGDSPSEVKQKPSPELAMSTPTPVPSPPTREHVLGFIDSYLSLGNSGSPPFGRKDVMQFPMANFQGGPITREEWTVRRGEFNQKAPFRNYTRLGTALFNTSTDGTDFSVIVPIAYALKQADGTMLEGVSIDRIGAQWSGGKLLITSHENLSTRVTMKNGVGILPNAWRSGKVAATRDGSTNLRYEESDRNDDSVLRSQPQGSPLQYLPQDERWLLVKNEEGIIGFMSGNFVIR